MLETCATIGSKIQNNIMGMPMVHKRMQRSNMCSTKTFVIVELEACSLQSKVTDKSRPLSVVPEKLSTLQSTVSLSGKI